jgi:hypothetical protein
MKRKTLKTIDSIAARFNKLTGMALYEVVKPMSSMTDKQVKEIDSIKDEGEFINRINEIIYS